MYRAAGPKNEISRNIYEVEEPPQNTNDRVILLEGDALEQMKGLPDRCVNCAITSPPYFHLRDYEIAGQLGWESSVEEYIHNQILVFREVRRLLVDDGIAFVVIGDSYADSSMQNGNKGPLDMEGVPSKNLLLVPQRLAIAFQRDDWIVRQEIIWHKKNPMFSSVKDRFTRAHETIWFLVKDPSYNFDQQAIQEDGTYPAGVVATGTGSSKWNNGGDSSVNAQNHHGPSYVTTGKRNKRDVFSVATNKDPGAKNAHFATFPAKLIEPLVLSGCPEGGVILDCYAGSGSTGEVALASGRSALLIELNPTYCAHIEHRLNCTRTSVVEAARRLSPEARCARARYAAAMRLWKKLNAQNS